MFVVPRYGAGSLADLLPAVLAGAGVPGEIDRLGLDLDATRVCVLLVDGLGADLLAAYPEAAPFLSGLAPRTLTAGFPTTTATGLGSFGTGVPPGEHGIVGYLLDLPGHERLWSPLSWRLHGPGPEVDLLKEIEPERFQPRDTAFERAVRAGIAVTHVGPGFQNGSGITRAVLRGSEFRPRVSLGDLVDGVVTAAGRGPRSLVYGYHADLDTTGHVRGPGSSAWLLELGVVDRAVEAIAERLPTDGALIVTADHGMVTVDATVDFDTTPELCEGVRQLGGEVRARHVYTIDGAAADVAARWRDALGDRFEVLHRDDAIARGWFGPTVTADAEPRIGDLVAVAREGSGIVRSAVEPLQSALIGHHGSLTAAEMNVPLLVFRP